MGRYSRLMNAGNLDRGKWRSSRPGERIFPSAPRNLSQSRADSISDKKTEKVALKPIFDIVFSDAGVYIV